MNLTYAANFDFTNINTWSGLGYYYGVMLKNAGFDLDYINHVDTPFHTLHFIRSQLSKRITGKLYSPRFDVNVSKEYAHVVEKRTNAATYIFSPNTAILANLKNVKKRILYADATFERLMNLYPGYSKLSKKCVKGGHEVDRLAIHNSDLLIYTSQWAADSAINYYNADPGKVFIAPFGANLEKIPSYNEIKDIVQERTSANEIHILYLGVDWVRKGGSKAIEIVNRLNENGLKATLHIVGFKGELPVKQHDHFINHGFISKDSAEGQAQFSKLFSMCHFLLLPTMADCTPVAFSEASAYGLPCITTDVGGNSCIIKNDINGQLFSLSDFSEKAVPYIINMIGSPQLYEQLCFSSYDRYCSELNWTATGKKIYNLISAL